MYYSGVSLFLSFRHQSVQFLSFYIGSVRSLVRYLVRCVVLYFVMSAWLQFVMYVFLCCLVSHVFLYVCSQFVSQLCGCVARQFVVSLCSSFARSVFMQWARSLGLQLLLDVRLYCVIPGEFSSVRLFVVSYCRLWVFHYFVISLLVQFMQSSLRGVFSYFDMLLCMCFVRYVLCKGLICLDRSCLRHFFLSFVIPFCRHVFRTCDRSFVIRSFITSLVMYLVRELVRSLCLVASRYLVRSFVLSLLRYVCSSVFVQLCRQLLFTRSLVLYLLHQFGCYFVFVSRLMRFSSFVFS